MQIFWLWKIVKNNRSINFVAKWKIKTCTSPCGTTVNHWASTTCYPSSALSCDTICPSETRTCYDWYWMNGNKKQDFNPTYTRTSCSRKATLCNSTDYPLTTSSISNWTTEPCGYYDVSNNVCSSKKYKYKITSCNPWYTLNESKTACVQIYCPPQWWCPKTRAGGTCTTYSQSESCSCNSYSKVIQCKNDGTWSATPYNFAECKFPSSYTTFTINYVNLTDTMKKWLMWQCSSQTVTCTEDGNIYKVQQNLWTCDTKIWRNAIINGWAYGLNCNISLDDNIPHQNTTITCTYNSDNSYSSKTCYRKYQGYSCTPQTSMCEGGFTLGSLRHALDDGYLQSQCYDEGNYGYHYPTFKIYKCECS